MQALHAEFPVYDWNNNKAYPTPKHREGIRKFGTTSYHRMSYDLLGDRKLEEKDRRQKKK